MGFAILRNDSDVRKSFHKLQSLKQVINDEKSNERNIFSRICGAVMENSLSKLHSVAITIFAFDQDTKSFDQVLNLVLG